MKIPKLLSMVVLAILMVAGIGCTTLQGTMDGYEDENTSYRRSTYDDPFFYNSYDSRPVLVRDVRTGRTFYVYPNSANTYYDNRYYNDRRYDNRRRNYNNTYYNNTNRTPVVTDQQRREQKEKAQESKRTILGKQN